MYQVGLTLTVKLIFK